MNFRSLPGTRSASIAFFLLGLGFSAVMVAQSGRIKDKTAKSSRPTSSSGPITAPANMRAVVPNRPRADQAQPTKPTSSANNSGEEIDPADTVRISSNLVPIPASVVDAKGIAITGLKLEDFELMVDGQSRPISEVTRTETSVRMAMLFDNSGSLDNAREFEKQAAMRFFRTVMRPSDEAAIYSVETESYLAQPLTKNVDLLQHTIASFGRPEGATSLFDAIVEASRYLRPHLARRVLVIVSDGIETMRENGFEATMQEALANDCQIFVVQTGLYDGANLRALAAERRMEQLSGQTGGAVYVPKTTTELDRAFQQIAADLAHQYVLSYYSGDEPRDGRFHVIDLRIKSRKDVRVRARKGYYSPKPSNVAANGW